MLIGEVYGGKLIASPLMEGRRDNSVTLTRSYVSDTLSPRAKGLVTLLDQTGASASDASTKVCMTGGKGSRLGSFRLGDDASSALSNTLGGFNNLDSLLVLDLAKAGLAPGGIILLPEGEDWSATLQLVKDTLKNAPRRSLDASLPAIKGSERKAYLELPVERLISEDRNLRIPVELSPPHHRR